MKSKTTKIISGGVTFLFLMLLSVSYAKAQPSEAQIRKDISGPRVVSLTFGKPGTKSWSKTYNKYYWTRYYTAKLKTDDPKVFTIVKGYVAYDIYGSKFTFWREFVSSNSFEGIPDPTEEDLQKIIKSIGYEKLMGGYYFRRMKGEPESMTLAAEPEYKWHTMNSVEFNIVAVYTEFDPLQKNVAPKRVKRALRIRLYRTDVKSDWNNALSSNKGVEDM